jgi:signal transduction histidine kinase
MPTPLDKLDQAERLLGQLEDVEGRLQQLQADLTRSHRLATLGTISSIIAHEFNNILTPMMSYCQLALQDNEDVDLMRKALQKSLNGAERAAQISSSMLGFARASDTEPTCNVATVVEEVFHCLARPPEKDGITLTLEIPDDIDVAVNPVTLQQVLLNLVLNARQAMRRKGGQLRLTVTSRGQTIAIEVIDTGPGIPPDLINRIFEPFVTQRDGDDGSGKGTGLGLTICRDLVDSAGGTIHVESEQGVGTAFLIELPAAPADEA